MGFLDHSTNNIIVDAVLTDRGRELLASQPGAAGAGGFSITKFSLSDDEVDYTIIEKYGRTVGKEKIIKNTPIFEAQTKSFLAQKFRMFTLTSSTSTHLPTLSVSPDGLVSLNATQNSVRLKVNTSISKGVVPNEISDDQFYVTVPSKLVSLPGRAIDVDETSSLLMATYLIDTASDSQGVGTRTADVILTRAPGIGQDDTLFSIYGSSGTITTVMSIVGADSGARKDITISVSRG